MSEEVELIEQFFESEQEKFVEVVNKEIYSQKEKEWQQALLDGKALPFSYTLFDDKNTHFKGSFHVLSSLWHRVKNEERSGRERIAYGAILGVLAPYFLWNISTFHIPYLIAFSVNDAVFYSTFAAAYYHLSSKPVLHGLRRKEMKLILSNFRQTMEALIYSISIVPGDSVDQYYQVLRSDALTYAEPLRQGIKTLLDALKEKRSPLFKVSHEFQRLDDFKALERMYKHLGQGNQYEEYLGESPISQETHYPGLSTGALISY